MAAHPLEFGLSAAAVPHVEYRFATGDCVDVISGNRYEIPLIAVNRDRVLAPAR